MECGASFALLHNPQDVSSYHVPSVDAGTVKERGGDIFLLFGAVQPWPPLKLDLGLALCPPLSDIQPLTSSPTWSKET